jgi:hypothetical protein
VLRILFKARFLGLAVPVLLAGMWPVAAQAATMPGLGTAADFAVLAGKALTCTDSNVTGPVGVVTGIAVTSTRCKMQVQNADGAYSDFLKAYSTIADSLAVSPGCPPANTLTGTLAGVTLGPGTYCFDAAAALTGTLTLTGGGPWVFEIGARAVGALTANSFTVVSDSPCNAFWWVQADVTLTTSTFQGTILGGGDITLTGTSIAGRVLATGAVTMTGSNIFGCNAAGTVASHHCNQGVGNGPEGCDPGNSNQGDPSRSNDELGGTPGDPGRQGGNGKQETSVSAQITPAGGATVVAVAKVNVKHDASVAHASASNKDNGNGKSKSKGKAN